ncbi:MAG: YodL domain-containing protein [Clostridiales bacterium]|nr:YodL domain-containing protein [Clostridiales bacterium]
MNIQAWDEVHGAKSQENLQAFLESQTDSYAILQLKRTDETTNDRFMNDTWLAKQGREPEVDHYAVVYTGRLPAGTSLDELYMKFNIDHPADYTGHSLSVSDIVALKQAGVVTCYYVDSIGFRELPHFHPENHLKNAEMAMEDDYSMLDGILNNGRKEAVNEERSSVLEKLKNMPESEIPMKPVKHREERGLE